MLPPYFSLSLSPSGCDDLVSAVFDFAKSLCSLQLTEEEIHALKEIEASK
jgi:hypothetical protein